MKARARLARFVEDNGGGASAPEYSFSVNTLGDAEESSTRVA
jgi:hypothetical protein